MSRQHLADFEAVAGDLLQELGYEVTNATVPIPIRGLRTIQRLLRPLLHKSWRTFEKLGG